MDATIWNPSRELADMSDRLNHVFARMPRGRGENEAMTVADWVPLVDIIETAAEYIIKAEIPGVKKEDVKVTLEHGVLSIRGTRRQEVEGHSNKFHRVEGSYGNFVRNFSLPDLVDDTKLEAVVQDGVLILHLPKTEKAKPKAIEVKVA